MHLSLLQVMPVFFIQFQNDAPMWALFLIIPNQFGKKNASRIVASEWCSCMASAFVSQSCMRCSSEQSVMTSMHSMSATVSETMAKQAWKNLRCTNIHELISAWCSCPPYIAVTHSHVSSYLLVCDLAPGCHVLFLLNSLMFSNYIILQYVSLKNEFILNCGLRCTNIY